MAIDLQIEGLSKSFGALVLFENISFSVEERQRIGLIARNGKGKSTLLKIIAGGENYDSGSIVFRKDLKLGYLEQEPHFESGLRVIDACLPVVTNMNFMLPLRRWSVFRRGTTRQR